MARQSSFRVCVLRDNLPRRAAGLNVNARPPGCATHGWLAPLGRPEREPPSP